MNSLQENTPYAAMIFDWRFATQSGLCPPELEQQYAQYRSAIAQEFYEYSPSILISKKNNNSLIRTAMEFRSLIKRFPMMMSKYVRVNISELTSISLEGDITKLVQL